MRFLLPLGLIAVTHVAAAQTAGGPLDVRGYGVVLDHPDTRRVTVHENVTYLTTPAR